jgi:hypothetical protein
MKDKTLQIKTMYYSIKEVEFISAMAKEKAITFSEMVRRILDDYIERDKKNG